MTETPNLPDPRLLTWTAKQTAAVLGVTLSTVKALQASGELRPVDICGEARYLPDAVRAYVAELRPVPQRGQWTNPTSTTASRRSL